MENALFYTIIKIRKLSVKGICAVRLPRRIRKAADRRTNARKGWRDDRKMSREKRNGVQSGLRSANLYISHRLICSTRSRRKGKTTGGRATADSGIPAESACSGACALLETAQENLTLRLTADDHLQTVRGVGLWRRDLRPVIGSLLLQRDSTGKMEAGEHCFGLHLYYQGLINRVYNGGDLRFAFCRRVDGCAGLSDTASFCYERTDALQRRNNRI